MNKCNLEIEFIAYLRHVKLFIREILIISTLCCLQGCTQESTPNFQQMTLPRFPNYYLVCPAQYCNVTPNALSPVYPISAEDLFNLFNQLMSEDSRVHFAYTIPEQGQFQLTRTSMLLGLTDDIAVQFIALSESTSTLAIYSQTRYTFYDFGQNKRRIAHWLEQLNKRAARVQPRATT